jgi:hypothetical protein
MHLLLADEEVIRDFDRGEPCSKATRIHAFLNFALGYHDDYAVDMERIASFSPPWRHPRVRSGELVGVGNPADGTQVSMIDGHAINEGELETVTRPLDCLLRSTRSPTVD